jgi:hypothetical protein
LNHTGGVGDRFDDNDDSQVQPPTGDYEDEQTGANGNKQIKLVVLGERHSGLPWLEKRLAECFPDMTVSFTRNRERDVGRDVGVLVECWWIGSGEAGAIWSS